MSIESIELWHKRARPTPTDPNFQVQLGCHFEEIAEMLEVLRHNIGHDGTEVNTAYHAVKMLADHLKAGKLAVSIMDRRLFLDSLADQVVTAVGTGHCANMQTGKAIDRVNQSNWSKFDEGGQPIFNEQGKIMKNPRTYSEADLSGLY